MPNQNFRGPPHDDINVIDCQLGKNFKSCQPSEKVCRFAYASWCPVCDLDIHRKRSKSECTDVNFRKRGRDNMKTPSPKKCDRSQDYYTENKDFMDHRDSRLDSSRVRTNLCELPTSYITGNCQINVPSNHHDKQPSKKFIIGNVVELPDRNHQVHNNKSYSSEIGSDFSSFIHSSMHSKDDHSKGAMMNGDCKSNRVHRYINLSGIILDDDVESEYKSNFIRTLNKANGLHVSPATKSVRDVPIPHKERSPVPKKLSNDPSSSPKDCNTPKIKTDREKCIKHNAHCEKKLVVQNEKPATADSKLKEPPVHKKCNSNEQPKHRPRIIKISSSPAKTELAVDKKEEVIIVNNEEIKPPSPNCETAPVGDSLSNINVQNVDVSELKRQRVRNLSDSDNSNDQTIEQVSETPKTAKKKAREVSPLESRKENRKAPVKFPSVKSRHKLNSVKLRKVRNKIAHSVSSDSNFSDSDASSSEEEESSEEDSFKDVVPNSSQVKIGSTPVAKTTAPITVEPLTVTKWPVRPSLFPNVPPYISFTSYDSPAIILPPGVGRFLKWRLSTITPIIVKKTLQNTGFRLVKSESPTENSDWTGCWGKQMKSVCFQTLRDTQKLNHFPGTFQIGRKDRLWKNLQRLMFKYGTKEFGFIPRTYVLPQDLKPLRNAWEKTGDEKWIIKPPASARGTGIKVIHRWAHLPKKKALVVQEYISNPYLINGSKFDLRLYVLVTSFNPLRIYLYPDGLARFASSKYSDDLNSLSDRYVHLTNYSINKLSSQYTANEDANACKGHKWTISKLWDYMEGKGVNTKNLWRGLQQLVIKTIISGESSISQLCKANVTSRYNCYELFGIDVLLDERLKPWLLEVNISPSLHSASPLDLHVKGPLVQTLLNIAQFHLPPKLVRMKKNPGCFNTDIYTTQLTTKERVKHITFVEYESRAEYLSDILEDLTGDDVRHLIQAEDELSVIGSFERVFPTKHTHQYLQFMDARYYNRLFDAWEHKYEKNRKPGIKLLQSLCEKKRHLEVAPTPVSKEANGEGDQNPIAEQPIMENPLVQALDLKKPPTTAGSCNTDAA